MLYKTQVHFQTENKVWSQTAYSQKLFSPTKQNTCMFSLSYILQLVWPAQRDFRKIEVENGMGKGEEGRENLPVLLNCICTCTCVVTYNHVKTTLTVLISNLMAGISSSIQVGKPLLDSFTLVSLENVKTKQHCYCMFLKHASAPSGRKNQECIYACS